MTSAAGVTRACWTAQDMAKWLPTIEEPVHLDWGHVSRAQAHPDARAVLLQMLPC